MNQYITAFNNELNLFLDNIEKSFPEVSNLDDVKSQLNMAKTWAPTNVPKLFMSNVGEKYYKEIVSHNENAFGNMSLSEELGDDNTEIMNIMVSLKNVWASLSDNNKMQIWKFLETLILLGALSQGSKYMYIVTFIKQNRSR